MKFVCTQENLRYGVSLVSKLPSRSVGLPILNNVMLEVVGGVLKVSSTNLEIGVITEIRGKSESDGSFTVDAKVFSDYVSMLPGGNVTLELVKGQLKVECGNFSTKIRGQSSDEFPIIPRVATQKTASVDSSALKECLSKTMFSVSLDSMRPEITGVLMSGSGKKVVMVATDSYRLSECALMLSEGEYSGKCIIPLRALSELDRALSGDDVADMYVDENQIMFVVGQTIIISKLIEGEYPDHTQIIPKSFSTVAEVGKNDLMQATRAASLFARSGIYDISLKFGEKKGVVEVGTSNVQVGEQETRLDADISGSPLTVVFNYKYLLDGLQSFVGDIVVFKMDSSTTPVVMKSDKDKEYLYMIMPIKQ